MSSRLTILRSYYKILSRLKQGTHPDKSGLLDLFEDDPISERTLERYLTGLKTEFGLIVRYNRSSKGYYLENPDDLKDSEVLKILEYSVQNEFILDLLADGKKSLEFIQFEDQGLLSGVEHLRPLFKAIKAQRVIEIYYTKFRDDKIKSHQLYPYLLKEYQGRWYVIGHEPQSGDLRTFSIDRIRKLTNTVEFFRTKTNFEDLQNLKNIIGVNWEKKKIQTVVLRMTEQQAKYQEALPWHPYLRLLCEYPMKNHF
jgi:proteasome accessory factor B